MGVNSLCCGTLIGAFKFGSTCGPSDRTINESEIRMWKLTYQPVACRLTYDMNLPYPGGLGPGSARNSHSAHMPPLLLPSCTAKM